MPLRKTERDETMRCVIAAALRRGAAGQLRISVTNVVSKIGTTNTSTGTARTATTLLERPPPGPLTSALDASRKPTNIDPQSPMKIDAG